MAKIKEWYVKNTKKKFLRITNREKTLCIHRYNKITKRNKMLILQYDASDIWWRPHKETRGKNVDFDIYGWLCFFVVYENKIFKGDDEAELHNTNTNES